MASSSLLSFSVFFLVLFHGCFARIDLVTNRPIRHHHQQEQPQRQQFQCQLQNLNALSPQHRFESEAGVTEFWEQNEEQFQCAGVAFLRHKIERKGLLLPSFTNAPMLMYIVQGEGIQGAVFPGCAETYQSQSQSRSERQQPDQHQKVRRFKEGDVIALPAGVSHWIYNNGKSQLVLVALVDVANNANQLDQNYRKFFLGGNPQERVVRGGRGQSQSQSRKGTSEEEERSEQSGGNNLLSGFDEKMIADVFDIDMSLARKLQSENDQRGAIVRMEHEFQSPEETPEEQQREQRSAEEEERRSRDNGVEETFCTMRLKHQTDSSFADVFNPRAGRITTVNSFNLPVLQWLQLSAERGVLYDNAIYAP